MASTQPFMRDDTFLGVFQALGEDFGFNPNWLRVAIAPLVVWNPMLVMSVYLALGVLIALLHWSLPSPAVPAQHLEEQLVMPEAAVEEEEAELLKAA